MWLVGQLTCSACGAHGMVLSRPGKIKVRQPCDDCGQRTAVVPVWWPASYWPEFLAKVQHEEAKQDLGLAASVDIEVEGEP